MKLNVKKELLHKRKKMPQENNPAHQDLQWMEKKKLQ